MSLLSDNGDRDEPNVVKEVKNMKMYAHNLSEFSDDMPDSIRNLVPDLCASLTCATEIALAVLGNVDAGKSSLTACLCDRVLDNGDGSARSRVFVHDHEKSTGRTSAISSKVIEYSSDHINAFVEGNIYHEQDVKKKVKIAKPADPRNMMKIVGLHDLCGHEKYFGTTSHGVSSMYPDAAILVINPSRGVLDMTKEHYKITISLNIPVIIVITKVDASLRNSCIETERTITDYLKKFKRKPQFLNSHDDYTFYKAGETTFLRLRSEFYKGENEYGFAERAVKYRIKIQSTRDERDAFFVTLKADINSHSNNIINQNANQNADNDFDIDDDKGNPADESEVSVTVDVITAFKDMYGLSDIEYDHLFSYLNYNRAKMNKINTIVSNLNMMSDVQTQSGSNKQSVVPVIYISNYTGYNLDTVRDSIMFLKPRDIWDTENNSIIQMLAKKLNKPDLGKIDLMGSVFYIDRAYTVDGVGLVISGINRGSQIKVNDKLWVGPINKNFVEIKIKSIHNDAWQFVDGLNQHHRGCLNITTTGREKLTKNGIRKGMVLISNQKMTQHVAYHFDAVITVLRNETKSTTIRVGACPLLDAGTIKQTARLISINEYDLDEDVVVKTNSGVVDLSFKTRAERKKTQEIVKPGEVKEVTLKFTQHPEFIPEGEQFIFRSGAVHGVGVVIRPIDISTDIDACPDPIKKKHRRVRASTRASVIGPDHDVNEASITSVKVD
jgi:GTPase